MKIFSQNDQSSFIIVLSKSENTLVTSSISEYIEFDDSISVGDGHLDWCCETKLDGSLISLLGSLNKVAPDIQLVAKLFSVTCDLSTLFCVSFETDRLSDGRLPSFALRSLEGCTLFRLHLDILDLAGVKADGDDLSQDLFDEVKAATAAIAARLPFTSFPSWACDAVKLFKLFRFSRRMSLFSNRL